MSKRTWTMIMCALALGGVLSACGSGDLAEDLTPIPTLAPGQTPTLADSIQEGAAAVAEALPDAAPNAGEEAAGEVDLVAQGERIFLGVCAGCHAAQDGVGPALTGMAVRAATRVEGQSAEAYLHESIVDPGAVVVEGYQNIMPKTYGDDYSETELNGLAAYILAEGGGDEMAEEPAEKEPTEEPAEEEPTEEPEAAEGGMPGDPAAGEAVFTGDCAGCHKAEGGVGPAFTGMGERAATRVEGQSAEAYLHESIVDPGAYVVEGYQNIMPLAYGDTYDEQQLADIIAYILAQ
ncbi:MAG: c-type cytochrome [Anaerolineae bacterium]|nr:c-type cytochrome [Anaerolineae bacterium]